jgi:hypothetical protein
MLTDWLLDPVRRWQMLLRAVEAAVGVFCGGAVLHLLEYRARVVVDVDPWRWWWLPLILGAGVLAEWAVYEFLLEPYFGAGPYWERGPREGKTFIKWAAVLVLAGVLAGCAAPGALTVQPESGKRFIQWQARENCEAVYLPTTIPSVHVPGIRCP